jgi:hypothetical protein
MEDEVAAVVVDNGSGMVKVRSDLASTRLPLARSSIPRDGADLFLS